ncbi:MAG: class I SAM-dependent methyltransferase [Dehalococcoidia bacterium]
MTGVAQSVSFDRAADFYDETRADPPDVAAKLTDALLRELAAFEADRLLEVGVGTGRIARPLLERGVRVTGVDIAPRMMAKLREQLAPQHARPDLLLADATALPFAPRTFRAVFVTHVLHLVSSYEAALDEVRRVVAPGGAFIHHHSRFPDEVWKPSMDKCHELMDAYGVERRERPSEKEIRAKLRALRGSVRRVEYAEFEWRLTPSYWVECARNRVDSWSWQVPDEVYPPLFADYERWMHEHYGDMERERPQRVQHALEVWTFDGG